MTAWEVALLAAGTMLVTDVLGVVMVQAEAKNRGWLAGIMDAVQWVVGITTTTLSVTAFQGHRLSEKLLVGACVTVANVLGTKLGQLVGKRWVTDRTLEERLSALERMSHMHHNEGVPDA